MGAIHHIRTGSGGRITVRRPGRRKLHPRPYQQPPEIRLTTTPGNPRTLSETLGIRSFNLAPVSNANFLPREIKDSLFNILDRKETDLELKAEAAMVLSQHGYTTNKLISSINRLLDAWKEPPSENLPQVLESNSFGSITTIATPSNCIEQTPIPRAFELLVSALYNIHKNLKDQNGVSIAISKYGIREDGLKLLTLTFVPRKLNQILKIST